MSTKAAETKALSIRKAPPPFDREDADFIIRSRDKDDFYVFRAVLMLASKVFEDMLPIPQPPPEGSSNGNAKPVVAVSEENHIIDTFLRVVYPLTTPETTSLFHVREVLEAGMKYDASVVVNEMRAALTKPCFLADDPLQVFSIAYNWRFEEEARIAAANVVVQGRLDNIDTHLPALTGITAGAYYRLMRLHRNHTQPGSGSNKVNPPPMSLFSGIGPFCRKAPLPSQSLGGTLSSTLPPFTDPRADLVIKSHDDRTFRVHRAILDVASPTLLSSLVAEDSDTEGSPPVYRISENSAVVDALLRLFYPGRRPRFSPPPTPSPGLKSDSSATHFLSVLTALQRYAPAVADDLVASHWATYACRDPFRFFFHAIARGLAPQARTCAQLFACSANSSGTALHALYVLEMEAVGALAYHRLLAYVHAYRAAALASVRECTWVPKSAPKPGPDVDLASRTCAEGVKCVCAALPKSKTLPPALLQMLAARLQREPRGGVLLHDRALVDAFAEAAHDVMCVPELNEYVPPSPAQVFLALAIGWWFWSLLVVAVVALAMGQIQVRCGCPKGKHIPWAEASLRDIAGRVDEAVSQVGVLC